MLPVSIAPPASGFPGSPRRHRARSCGRRPALGKAGVRAFTAQPPERGGCPAATKTGRGPRQSLRYFREGIPRADRRRGSDPVQSLDPLSCAIRRPAPARLASPERRRRLCIAGGAHGNAERAGAAGPESRCQRRRKHHALSQHLQPRRGVSRRPLHRPRTPDAGFSLATALPEPSERRPGARRRDDLLGRHSRPARPAGNDHRRFGRDRRRRCTSIPPAGRRLHRTSPSGPIRGTLRVASPPSCRVSQAPRCVSPRAGMRRTSWRTMAFPCKGAAASGSSLRKMPTVSS